jgi:hypothetical protein
MGSLVEDLLRKGETALQDLLDKGEKAVRDAFGLNAEARDQSVRAVLAELRELTTDDDDEVIRLRSLMVYRALVRHVKSGGTVKLIGPGAEVKTLKVRLR